MRSDIKLLPSSLEAEMAVVGCMFLSNASVDTVCGILSASDFYSEVNRTIFEAFIALWDRGCRGIDAVTLAEELSRIGKLADVGGPAYLLELAEAVPHAAHVKHYAEIVRTKARQRLVAATAGEVLAEIMQPLQEGEIEASLARLESTIHRAIESGQRIEPQPLSGLMPELLGRLASGGTQRFIPTGFPGIDQTTGGLGPGKVVVLAARTSHGKTAMVCSLAMRLGVAGTGTLIVSYEQSWPELAARLLAIDSRVNLSTVESGRGKPEELFAVAESAARLGALPIRIDDSQPDETALIATIRMQARKHRVQVVVVDYLGLVEPRDRKVIREQQVAGVSRSLKRVALETGVCVVLLSQLNRGVENRDDKRPRLADLRESGAVEQDADQVWLLHRPNRDSQDEPDDHGELHIAKNRSGPLGLVRLAWNPKLTEYADASYTPMCS